MTQIKVIYNKFVSVISYEASFIEIYSNKALAASPSFAAYEVEGDELSGDLASFSMANAIYAGLVEGYASEVSSWRVNVRFPALIRRCPTDLGPSQRHGERFQERRGDDCQASDEREFPCRKLGRGWRC